MKSPGFQLLYNNQDITKDLSPFLISASYTDRVTGESDDVEFTLKDSDGRFSAFGPESWYMSKGAKIDLKLGYTNNMVPCGNFEVDEITISGGLEGDFVTVKAISALINSGFRTSSNKAYEKIKLRDLAKTIASKAKLTVSGNLPDITLNRITQFKETDLGFLNRVASEFGIAFNIKGGYLVFTQIDSLHARNPVGVFGYRDFSYYNITDATNRTFRQSSQRYFDQATGKVITSKKVKDDTFVAKNDSDISFSRIENSRQGELKDNASLLKSLQNTIRGTVQLSEGNVAIMAGMNIELADMGIISGTYQIESSTHSFDYEKGYGTNAVIYKIK